ncbi:MAG: helix-turn-helix domain-containing protein, partial [Pseudomonadota bacterium]
NVVERAVYSREEEDTEVEAIVFDPFDSPWRPGGQRAAADDASPPSASAAPSGPYEFKEHVQQLEIDLLKQALEQNRYNQKKTAQHLGMTYHQLRGYLRKYGLTDSEGSEAATG